MRNRRRIVTAVIYFTLTSCNLPSPIQSHPSSPTPDTPPSSVSTPTLVPIETLLALGSPTVPPTRTPSLSIAFSNELVNCRSGPGTSYAIVGELRPGGQAEMVGKSADLSWWYVKNPSDPSTFCWLASDFTSTEGNVELLAVANPPEITVTALRVSIEPPVMNVACNGFPKLVTVNVQITVSGPAEIVWRWEEISTGDVSPEKNVLFEEGGTKTVQDLYQVKSARDYTIRVQTLQPSEQMGEATFKAVCTP